MDKKEELVIKLFDELEKNKDIVTSQEVVFIMNNHKPDHFKDQEECDNTLAKLISKGKIKKKFLIEDKTCPFNLKLKEAMKN